MIIHNLLKQTLPDLCILIVLLGVQTLKFFYYFSFSSLNHSLFYYLSLLSHHLAIRGSAETLRVRVQLCLLLHPVTCSTCPPIHVTVQFRWDQYVGFTVTTVFCFCGISLLLTCFCTFLIIELTKFFTNYINLRQCSDAAGVLSFMLPQKPLPELWADIPRCLVHRWTSGAASVTTITFSVSSCLLFSRVNFCVVGSVGS